MCVTSDILAVVFVVQAIGAECCSQSCSAGV